MSVVTGDIVDHRDYDNLWRDRNTLQRQMMQIAEELFPFTNVSEISHEHIMCEIRRLSEFEYDYRNNE